MRKLFVVMIFLPSFSACSNHQVYDALQTSHKNECEQLQTVQRDECMKRLGPDYRDYERERQKLEKK